MPKTNAKVVELFGIIKVPTTLNKSPKEERIIATIEKAFTVFLVNMNCVFIMIRDK